MTRPPAAPAAPEAGRPPRSTTPAASSSSPHFARNWRSPIGYARTSTARQELASQLEALHRAECHKVFKEQISTRVKVRPELERVLALAHQFKEAAPETPVILTVHELKRLARNAAELMTLSADLQAGGIQLELLTGPLTGIYDPNGMGAMFFAVALKDRGVPVPEIAKKLTIKVGKNAGKSPSVTSLYRRSPRPRPPRRTTTCRPSRSPSASAGPRAHSPPKRSTSANGFRSSPIRTPISAADDHDQALSANGCTAGPHGRCGAAFEDKAGRGGAAHCPCGGSTPRGHRQSERTCGACHASQ
ncbi:recombinase family protein [Streptomyces sp. NPDC006290]|uniref:recombinase family protein n=1 Tax=Streptomyces sp. NPDC006290 TaxID=3156745 RepID=UPI0033B6B82F